MLKNISGAINPAASAAANPATGESLAASAAATPTKFFPLLSLSDKRDLLAYTLGFLSPPEATRIRWSSRALKTATETRAFSALWQQHIQRDCSGLVIQQSSPQAYYQARFQDKALEFLLKPENQILKGHDYSNLQHTTKMKHVKDHFKTWTLEARANCLTQWNNFLGLGQLAANHGYINLRALTELTPAVMQRLIEINQKTPIKHLRISGCYLPQLPKALIIFLRNCSQLEKLDLSKNRLQSLPETFLQTCARLENLELGYNQLQSLPETLLQSCIRLKKLDLRNNEFQSLPETLLQFCTEVEELNLGSNQLQSLPEALLQTCTQLKRLGLNRNQLQSLPETLLQTCARLENLELGYNQLQSLPEALLKFCTQLTWLGLDNNQLQSLPETLLKFCTRLEQLVLNNNGLQSLPETLLETCIQLQQLYLNNNQLQYLPEALLETCIQLRLLYLNNNHLMDITHDDFSHLTISYLLIDSQTPVAASSSRTPSSSDSSSDSSSEEKMEDNEEDQLAQKKMRIKR